MFRHVMKTDDVEIDALKKQNETLLQNIWIFQREKLKVLDSKIIESAERKEKFTEIEKEIQQKNNQITCLEDKVDKTGRKQKIKWWNKF